MNIGISDGNDCTVLTLDGRLDSNTSEMLTQQLNETMDNGQHRIVIDFSKLAYISSAGLRVLLMAAKRGQANNGKLILCNMQDHIREVFEISGFLQILTVVNTREEAEEMAS